MRSSSIVFVFCLAAVALLWSAVSSADNDQPFGVFLRPLDGASRNKTVVPDLATRRALEAAKARVESLQLSRGPYTPDLAESLVEAAAAAEQAGDSDQALELYGWALQNTRINDGLNGSGQLPILERIVDVLREQGDPTAVKNRVDYFYRLLGYGKRPWSNERLAASLRWLKVQIEFHAERQQSFAQGGILDVYTHGLEMTEEVCGDPAWRDAWCKPFTLQFLGVLYLIDFYVDPLVEVDTGMSQYSVVPGSRTSWEMSPGQERMYTIERMITNKGRALLEFALALQPDDIELKLALADWNWFGDRRSSALDLYRSLVAEQPNLLKAPVPLPQGVGIDRDTRLISRWGAVSVDALITTSGRPRDITVTPIIDITISTTSVDESKNASGSEQPSPDDGSSASSAFAGYARQQVRELRFRPAFDDAGNAVEASVTLKLAALKRGP